MVWYYHLLASLLPGAPARPQPGSYESYPKAASRLAGVTLDEVWKRGSCFGSPARVVELIKSYMGRTGTTHLAVEMRIGGLEHKKVLRSMELFAKYVIPVLREEEAKLAATRGETGRC